MRRCSCRCSTAAPVIGVLAAFDRGPGGDDFTADDEQLLRQFATSAANAVTVSRSVEADRLRSAIDAADAERRRWARELHDQTLQSLGGLRVLLASTVGRDDAAAKDRAHPPGDRGHRARDRQPARDHHRPSALAAGRSRAAACDRGTRRAPPRRRARCHQRHRPPRVRGRLTEPRPGTRDDHLSAGSGIAYEHRQARAGHACARFGRAGDDRTSSSRSRTTALGSIPKRTPRVSGWPECVSACIWPAGRSSCAQSAAPWSGAASRSQRYVGRGRRGQPDQMVS